MKFFRPAFWLVGVGVFVFCSVDLFAEANITTANFSINDNDEQLVISVNKKPFVVYQNKDVPFKPYVKELYTPSGYNVLLDAPKDHLHHHGLMFAVSVDGVSFWEETEKGGKQVVQEQGNVSSFSNDKEAGVSRTLQWITPEKKTVLIEKRTISVVIEKDLPVLHWQSSLSLPDGVKSVKLGGSHYYGLGMRFQESLDKIGKFSNSEKAEGKVFRGEELLYPGKWCAYTVSQGEHPLTSVMFDISGNMKPATWFTMKNPFAYLSATLKYHEEPIELMAGKTLDLHYAVSVWDGVVPAEKIEEMSNSVWKYSSK